MSIWRLVVPPRPSVQKRFLLNRSRVFAPSSLNHSWSMLPPTALTDVRRPRQTLQTASLLLGCTVLERTWIILHPEEVHTSRPQEKFSLIGRIYSVVTLVVLPLISLKFWCAQIFKLKWSGLHPYSISSADWSPSRKRCNKLWTWVYKEESQEAKQGWRDVSSFVITS